MLKWGDKPKNNGQHTTVCCVRCGSTGNCNCAAKTKKWVEDQKKKGK